MRKLTLLISMLFLSLGMAWAQPAASPAPANGKWALGTTWYQIKTGHGNYLRSDVVTAEGDLLLTNSTSTTDDVALWCFVGDAQSGYTFYNRATGPNKPLAMYGEEDGAYARLAESPTGTTAFDFTQSKKSGGTWWCLKEHGSDNNYWNKRSNKLVYWNSTQAVIGWGNSGTGDDGSALLFIDMTTSISNVGEFVNGKVYTVSTTTRGGWSVKADFTKFCSTADAGLGTTTSKVEPRNQFAVLKSAEGNYYLYSLAAKKFVKADCSLAENIGEPIVFTEFSNNRSRVNFKGYSNKYINLGGSNQMTVDGWSTIDEGNNVMFLEIGEFDYEAVLRTLNVYELLPTLDAAITNAESKAGWVGTEVGKYSYDGDYADELDAAKTFRNAIDQNTTVAAVEAKIAALNTMVSSLSFNAPATGKYYRLKNAVSDNYMSAKNATDVVVITDGANAASTIFYLDEDNAFRSFTQNKYLDSNNKNLSGNKNNGLFAVAWNNNPTANVITYKNNGAWTFGAGTDGASIDRGLSDPNKAGYNWYIEEVTELPVATLAELQAALAADNELPIIITAQIEIPAGETVTIDLNGKTVTVVYQKESTDRHIYALSNYGTLTIQDTKGNGSINSRGIYNHGSLTLNAGAINAIDGNGGYAVNNQDGSTFVMNGGVVAATNEDDHQSSSGGSDATALKVPAGCEATLNGGTINDVCDFTYAIEAKGTLNIPAASTITVNGTHGAIYVGGGETTINAGTYTIPKDNYSRTDHVLYVSGGSLFVNGGTFIGDSDTAAGGSCLWDAAGTAVVNGGTFQGSSGGDVLGTTGTTIKGGTFENLIEKQHIAAGYELNADGTVVAKPVAEVNGTKFMTFAEAAAAAAAQADSEIKLLANINGDITVPANVTLNGNGFAVSGGILAAGEITFAGETKAASFNVENTNTVVNIPARASLELTGGRMVIGHGCTFNITGQIAKDAAKTTDKAALKPSLVMPGASFTGAGVIFNVTNAYISAPSSYCSSSKSASGTFDFNITNSIWECAGKLAFESQSTAATVNFDLVNSVLNTGSHLVFGVSRGEVVIDNSNVNVGKSNQIENRSTMTIKNGSVVNGAVATSSNAINPGTIIVENATYAVTGEFSGTAEDTGTIIIKKGANVSVGSIKAGANVTVDAEGMTASDVINFTANLSQFTGELSVINNDKLEAKIVDGKIVLAAKPVAKIGEQGYATLDEAVQAAQVGDKITLLDDADLAFAHNPQYNNVYASEIDLNGKTMTMKKGDVRFDNVTIKNGNIIVQPGTYSGTAIFLMYSKNLTLDGVKVTATGVAAPAYLIGLEKNGNNPTSNLTLNNSEIIINNESLVNIGSIIAVNGSDNTVTIKGSKIDVKNSNARLYLGGTNGKITVENSDIDLNGVKEGFYLRAGQTLAITGTSTVDITLITNDGRYGINLTDITATYTKAETATVNATLHEVTPVAVIGEKKFATLQAAIDAVQNGETIILQKDCAEAVTFTQTKEVSFVLDGNNKTYTGSINITARAGKDAPSTLVIKNFNFKTDAIAHDFIKSVETNYYPNNITISNCKFEGTADINTENYAVVAVRLKSANNIKIENCTGSGLHSFLQNTAGWNMQIDNVDVTNSLSGFAMGTVQGAGIKNCDLTVNKSGIRFDAQLNNNAVITDNKINAFIPVVVRKASVESSLTFNGENTMTATNTDGIWFAAGASEYVANGQMPTAATGKVKVTLNDTGLSAAGVYGDYVPVAKIGDVEYTSLEAAFAAATENQTITLLDNATPALTSQRAITKAAEIDLGGKTLTLTEDDLYFGTTTFKNGTIVVDPSVTSSTAVFWMFANQTLTFDDVKIVATGVTGTYLIGLEGDNSHLNLLNGSKIIIDNAENKDFIVIAHNGNGNIKVENSTIDVKNVGRGFLNGNVTISDSQVNLAGISKAGFRINANQTLAINGNSTVTVEGALRDGGIHLTDVTAKYTKAATATVNATVNEPAKGSITVAYTSETSIWGEGGGNAKESLVIKVLDANDNVMGTSTLNNVGGIIDGDVYVTWSIMFNAPAPNPEAYWSMEWTTAPSVDNMPAKVAIWVDGVEVGRNNVVLNGPDDLNKIVAAVTDADGKILSCQTSVAKAVETGAKNIALLRETNEEITLPAGVELNKNGFTAAGVTVKMVAKVGNTEYSSIDKAIAAWTNNTTLTLLDNVTLSDVVTLKSTEHHILDLGTYTMTAASGKNAFEIIATGTGDAERTAITIKADANNPGGINAGSKSIVYYDYSKGTATGNDRPIIKIEGGVFTASTSSWGTAGIYTKGTAARKCATLNISGGTFNCSINGSGKSKLIISGGVFNYSVGSQGDSTALRLISGGTFKTFGFMTADSNNTKFWFGTSMGNSNVGVHVDDNGYIVVGGAVVTEAGDKFEASSTNYSGANSLLQYSSAKDNGLYYTSVEEAFADNNTTSGKVTVYADEIDMTGITYKGTIIVPAGESVKINNAPADLKVATTDGNIIVNNNGTYESKVAVAQIGETIYTSLADALAAATEGATVTLLSNTEESIAAINNVKLATAVAGGVTVKNTYSDWINMTNVAIGTGVTLEMKNVYYTNAGVNVIEGTLNATTLYNANNSKTTVQNGGKIATTGMIVNRYHTAADAGIYVYGDGDASTVEVKCDDTIGTYSGTFYAKDAVVNGNMLWIDYLKGSTQEGDNYSQSKPVFENSTVNITKELRLYKDATLTLVGANVTAGTVQVRENATPTVNVDANSTVKATTVQNLAGATLDAVLGENNIVSFKAFVAKVANNRYYTLEEAFKAATDGCTIEILSDVTVDYAWDARKTGAKFTVPVTINGNGKTIKFTASVNDNNYQAPFRFEADATVKNLIVDMSEVTDNRFRAISSKGNLTVDGCKFIGKDESLNCRAIIFGEGAGANVGNLAIAITNSEFSNWKRGITDNENGQDVKTATITGNTLENAAVYVSAYENVTFTGNTVAGAYVDIRSNTANSSLNVTATGNTLEENTDTAYNYIKATGNIDQEGFKVYAVAKIGDVEYTTIEKAYAALQEGDEIVILKKGSYALTVKNNVTITGAVAGVEFANIGAFGCNGANVTFNNVTFTYAENSTYKGLQHSGNLVYNNCTFNGQVFLYGQSETFNKCTFNTTDSNNYNVWTYGAKNVAFNECTFNSAGKSVLIYSESASNTNNVTVTKSQFIASQEVAGKAAIEMDSSLSGAISLTIDGETTATGFGTGNVSGNSLWNNKKGNNDLANNDITVKVGDTVVLAPIFEAQIGDAQYRFFQDAINAVQNGETITVLRDIATNVEIKEKDNVKVTIDGNGMKMTGTIKVVALSSDNDRRITIKNFNFEDTTSASVDFITSVETNHYPRLTVEGCTFTGSGDATDVALRLKSSKNVEIKNCTGKGLHSFIQNTSGWNLTIENVTVTESKSAFALGTVQGVTVKGCTADVDGYGIRMDAGYNNNAVLENNTVKAFIPVVVRKATVNSNVTFNGEENAYTATNEDGIWCAVGATEYEENGQMPDAATAQVKVVLNDTTLDAAGVYGSYYDALTIHVGATQNSRMVTRDIYVATMDEAVAQAKAINTGAVIYKVYGEVELTTGGSHGILDLGENVVIEGADAAAKLTIVGGGVPDIKGVTFRNITLADEGTYLPTANEFMYQNYIDCTFENVTFVDGIRLSGTSSIKDSKVDANTTNEYAIWLDEGEFTMTGTTVVGGADAYGLVKSDKVSKITITGNTFQYLGEANKEALNVKEAVVIAENNKFIDCVKGILPADKTNYTDESKTTAATDATIAGTNTVTVNYAAIGEQKFETLLEAINAVQEGQAITLLRDVTMDYNARDAYETQAQNVVINGNGKTLTLNQKNSDWASFGLANNSKLVLNNMTIEKTGYGDTSGAWNTHAIIFSCPVEMTDVTVNNSVAVQAGAALNNVTIKEANGYYGLWINGNGQTVTVNGGEINATNGGRGIKIADQYIDVPAQVTLTVDGTVFNTAKKAAVLVSSTAGANINAANVNIENVAEDKVNFVWVDEDWAANYGNVQVTGATVAQEGIESFVAAVTAGEAVKSYHSTLRAAVEAAQNGETVELLANVTLAGGYEDATEGLRIEREITLNGNGHTIDCGTFQKGIRVYNLGTDGDFHVDFNNVEVVNNVANGRCIDTRSHDINLTITDSKLIAQNGNSQPLTIGGSEAIQRVKLDDAIIDAGNSGYAVIAFVPVKQNIYAYDDTKVTGYAAFYLKDHGNANIKLSLGKGTYIGKNIHSGASNTFGTVVLEGDNNVLQIIGTNPTLKAITEGNASQAAVLIIGANNKVSLESESATIDIEGENAYYGMISAENAGATTIINKGNTMSPVAEVGGFQFLTIKEAIRYAGNEGTIKIDNDFELAEAWTIPAGKKYTLDLNGKTVSYTSAVAGEDMITNRGNLTITDSSDAKTGKLVYVNTDNTASNVTVSTISTEPGSTLVVDGGTIENKTVKADGSSIYSYAIDILTNGNLGDVNVTINGGKVYSDYMAIRQFNNGTACKNSLTINGGNIYGAKRAVQVHMDNNAAVTAIKGGKVEAGEGGYALCNFAATGNLEVTGGEFIGAVYSARENFISGGIYDAEVYAGYCAEGYMPNKNVDGTYGVVLVANVVATVDGYAFGTLAEAIAAVKAGDNTIELLADCAEKVTITQVNGTNIVINGNGKTYTGTITIKGDKVANNFYNTETLTFQNINFAPAYNTYAITAEKNTYARNITVDGCTFMGNNDVYGIRVRNGYNYTVKNTTAEGVYTFLNASEALTGLTVENVTVTCANVAFAGAYGFGDASFKDVAVESDNNGVKVNNPNGSALTFENCSITAKTPVTFIESAGVASALTAEFNGTNNMVVNNGGTYWFNIVEADGAAATFKAVVNDANLDMSNTAFAASVGNVYYSNLTAAVNAAVDGETVVVARDIELNAADCVTNSDGYSVFVNVAGKAITIDLNGKAVTANLSASQFASAKSSLLMAVFSVDTNGNLTLNDNVGTGKVAVTANDASVYSLISNYDKSAKLTINGGSYELDAARAKSSLIHSDPSEAVVVNGGNFYLGNVNTGANGSPWIFNVNGSNTGHVIVNGGTFNYDVNHQYWAFEVHVDKNKAVKANGDGTWTVVDAIAYVTEENNGYTREAGYATVEEAINSKYGNVVTILAGDYTGNLNVNKGITVQGEVDENGNNLVTFNGKLNITADGATVKNINVNNGGNSAGYINAKNVVVDGCQVVGGNGFRSCYTSGTVTFKNSTITGATYGIHFDGSANGNIVIENCTITGWTSFASTITNVAISGTTFAEGNYNQLRFYQNATITDCTFNEKMSIDFGKNGTTAAFNNCSVENGGNILDVIYIADIAEMGIVVTVDGVPVSVAAKVDGKYYLSLQAAIDAATEGQTVTIVSDIALTEGVTVAADDNIFIDLNGKTITGTPAEAKAFATITNRGTLTIQGEGAVVTDHQLTGSTGYAVNTITNCGTLTIDGATIENKSTAQFQIGYAIDNNSTTADATVTVVSGKVVASGSNYYDGIRLFCNSETKENSVVVEGGEVSTIWMQNPSDGATKNTKDVKGSVTIEGGAVGVLSLEPSANFDAAITAGHVGEVSYFQTAEGRDLKEFVTGGTFGTLIDENFLAWGYQVTNDAAPYKVEYTGRREEVTFIDGEFTEYTNEKEIEVGKLRYVRKFSTAWTPLYAPFEIPVSELAEQGLEVAYINGVRKSDYDENGVYDEGWSMELIMIHGGKGNADGSSKTLKANYPYFVRSKSGVVTMDITLEEATLYAAVEKSYDCTTFIEKYEITGNCSKMTSDEFEDNNYIVGANGWSRIKEGSYLNPFRFYMTVTSREDGSPVVSEASMSIVVRGEELPDGTTVIYDVYDENTEDMIFDLQGRRVLETEKGGIYIKGGKKFIAQ